MPSERHEQIVGLLRGGSLLDAPTVAEQREAMELSLADQPIGRDIDVIELSAGGVPTDRIASVDARGDRAVLYLHGGGYTLGSRRTHRELAARIARASGAVVYLAEYRLAPEHRFPAAVDDAVAVYRHLLDSGLAAGQLAIGGDSAGGGLTLATLLALKATQGSPNALPLPACAFALSPWIDLEGTGASAQPGAADDPMISVDGLRENGRLYAPNDLRHPLASPLYGDLTGLPPLLLQVGTRELLLDDATRIAAKAWQAGVDVELQVYAGLIHVWQALPALPEAAQAITAIAQFLARRLG